MITFINRFYGIVNFDECIPDYSGWRMRCLEKTWGFVVSSLFWLIIDIVWYNVYAIAVAVALVAIIRRTRGADQRAERKYRNGGQEGGQSQEQHLATSVSIHTNSQRFISIINKSSQDDHYTPETSTAKSKNLRTEAETGNTTEPTSNTTGVEKQKRKSHKSVTFQAKNKSKIRDESWTSCTENGTDSDPRNRPKSSTARKRSRGRPKETTQEQQRIELDWEETNREDDIQERTHSASLKSTPKQPPVNAGAPQTNTPTIDVTTLLQSVLAQRIQVNTQAPTNFPPPKKFDRSRNVHEWIRETQTTVLISDYEGRS
jgi:hypothetical protein